MNTATPRVLATAAATLAATLLPLTAHAAAFGNTRIGGEQGTPVTPNSLATYYNPGALGFSEGFQLGVYGSLAFRRASYSHALAKSDNPDPPDAQGANTGEAHLFNVFGGPSLGASLRLGNLALGAAFVAPFYGVQHWDHNDAFLNGKYPLAVVGVQRFFSIDDDLESIYFSVGAAYRLGPVSLGAAGNFIYTSLSHFAGKAYTGTGVPDTTAEGRTSLEVGGYNGSFAVGAMAELVPRHVWIGASYQAQPGLGAQTLTGYLVNTYNSAAQYYKATYTESLPDIVRAGVKYRSGQHFEVRAFGDYTFWSRMQTECTGEQSKPCTVAADGSTPIGAATLQNNRLYWNDTFGARLGVSYWLQPEVEVFVGGGYETAATTDATMNPASSDAPSVQGALGAKFKISDFLYLSASYTHIQDFDRDNTGKSTLAVLYGKPVSVPTVQGDAGGVYKSWVGIFNGNLEAEF